MSVPDYPTRLAALRAELKKHRLDGCIVPMTDEYMNEYVPDSAKRIRFLSGFAGSAGLIIVLQDKAAFFTDGRYTLQAGKQLPPGMFELHDTATLSPSDWVRQNLKAGQKLGYDPWLHPVAAVERYKTAAAKADAYLEAMASNPVDAVWADRPAAPAAPIYVHELTYAGVPSVEKRRQIAGDMNKTQLQAAMITDAASIAWLLNVRGDDVPHTPLPLSFAILHADATVDWYVDLRKITPELHKMLDQGIRMHTPQALATGLDALGKKHALVRVDPQGSPSWIVDRLRGAGAKLEQGADVCELPKACKNATELNGMRAAHRRDGAALSKFLHWVDMNAPTGKITEMDAEKALRDFRASNNLFRDLSFDTISGVGPNGAVIHYHATEVTNRKLEANTLYLIDSGGQYLDGTTDVTRTVALGAPSDEMRDRFTRVLKGHIALASIRFPVGTTGQELDALARQYLWAAGVDYNHGTGHGVGCFLGVHEGPQNIARRSSRDAVALRPGMVVSNEPGYYKAGHYGIRIENLQVVTEPETLAGGELPLLGFETLTFAPIDRRLVVVAMLSPQERDWLNAYHRKVFEIVSPQLEGEALKWLEAATAAI
jgi:Xaa-Pro aminopeptidase